MGETQLNFYQQKSKGFTPLEITETWRKHKESKSLTGFTLTEVLVVVAVFVVLIVIIYGVQVFSQRAYQQGEMATEILQNGRVILERMSREMRQAKYIVTSLPEIPNDPEFPPPSDILFQDGHTSAIIESDFAQGAQEQNIVLAPTASAVNDYYKDTFLKIIEGTGVGQIRKITNYDGSTKVATIDENWDTIPVGGNSKYRIDSSYYYIKYWRDGNNYLKKQIIGYCFPEECDSFIFAPWNTQTLEGQTLYELDSKVVLKEESVGEYLTDLKFWGAKVVNISLILEDSKGENQINLKTKIFGRNL